ncbi:Glycosyltransferase family 29 (Sialyltransferase) family protein [Heracleum sosnowskyi]|uniref:Glycosyltransferase family 29 (Sialyltransferase) family protein n=1 Tax=Heracleum sosnowskyi TaxID=360622 RepID=A0AAD8M824_9APIA|nr:Glycosyltransferase family 29 (Sialyltransferase) family protein [Heracleum sosnowskyi]
MTELHPPDTLINGGGAAALTLTSNENVGAKRQRRPSVRLGDIGGDQSFDSHLNLGRSRKFQWKNQANSSSKTRALLNLSGGEFQETLDGDEKEGNLDGVAIGSWKVGDFKSKRRSSGGIKRIRSNWVSKMGDGGGDCDDLDKFSDDGGEGFRNVDDSESPVKGGDSMEEFTRGVELDGPSENWENCNGERNGVRVWLNELGLGRYAPVFEIHEVDDEVLPMLTLEDLKDMGINAVGSRRKMFSSIQKLGKNFS